MSNLSPSISDIPAAPLNFHPTKDPLLSYIDSAPMPSPDRNSTTSPYQEFSSVISLQKVFTNSPSVPNTTYIKLQDAVNNFKANTCKSAGLPPRSFFVQENKGPQQSTTQPIRSQSPVTPCLTSRGTDNRSQSRNQGRGSITNTSIRESPSRTANLNSSRNCLNVSRREGSAGKDSPSRVSNMSLDNGKYSVIHKRDNGINQLKTIDIGKYRPQTSRPMHHPEEVGSSQVIEKHREGENSKFNVLKEILSPDCNGTDYVRSSEKEKSYTRKSVLFQRDIVREVRNKLDTATRCPKHDQPYLLFSTVNKQLFCIDCAFHIPQSSQAKQGLVSLKGASHIITDLSRRMYNEADKKISSFEQSIHICKKNRDLAQQEYDSHMELIDREFSELMEALRKRKSVLKRDLSTVMEDTFNEIDNKINDLEFLKQSVIDTKEVYSPYSFEASVDFFAMFTALKETISTYDYQSFLLSRDHFNILEFKGKNRVKMEIEAIGKVLPSNYTSKSLQRPKSMPRCSRASALTDKKECLENNYQSQHRSGVKSAEKYDKTSSVCNSPEKKKNTPNVTPTKGDTSQLSTMRNSTKPNKVNDSRDDGKVTKSFSLRGDEENKKKEGSSGTSKNVLTPWSYNSNKCPPNPSTPNKENRQKFARTIDEDYYEGITTGRKRAHGASNHEMPRKMRIPDYMHGERPKGFFEEIETLKFMHIGKVEDDDSNSDVYKEVESVLASIKNKEIFSPKKLEFINPEFFKESNILVNQYHAQELYNMLPSGIKHTKLHYRLSRDGASSQVFHERCDNQGPCVILAKVEGPYVFGYYMPASFVKSDRYELSEDGFIFSLQNPLFTRPHKFPIREQKKLFGIFQSVASPCLGSTLPNKQDLLIQFDDLESSCSVIGYAYTLPPGIDGTKALAGRYTGWRFEEIEVYGLAF